MSDYGNKFYENSELFGASTSIHNGVIMILLPETKKKNPTQNIWHTVFKTTGKEGEWSLRKEGQTGEFHTGNEKQVLSPTLLQLIESMPGHSKGKGIQLELQSFPELGTFCWKFSV